MEDARGEVLHVDLECLPVAHAWDPWHFMNGGKWVTIADIRDLGHSKTEKRDRWWEIFDGFITCSEKAVHVILSCCRRLWEELQLKGRIYSVNFLPITIWYDELNMKSRGLLNQTFHKVAYLWFPSAVHISALQCVVSGDHLAFHLKHITKT